MSFEIYPHVSKPGRKKARTEEKPEAGSASQKPKKANSEVRKQQNRIASRNYREKRKRKLLYLQQLLHADTPPTDHPSPRASELSHEDRTRSVSAEYLPPTPILSPMRYPSLPAYTSLSSTSGNVIDPTLTSAIAFNDHVAAGSQPLAYAQSSWNHVYDHLADQANVGLWNGNCIPPDLSSVHSPVPRNVQSHPQSYYFEPMPVAGHHIPSVQLSDFHVMGTYDHCPRPMDKIQGLISSPFPSSFSSPGRANLWP
ncbi:hypothetical protein GQ43DRAFT_469011 [Delitschia confertaspora ATCC 74209]|uniref:BZIP domain-containing protein n=1 Tax=Delitschia confertaspora ATCC 74209 TaxID=1513339 RepID=A0A9P4JUD3_9PLEO|nr:hypothetical protein GQ43DRAFT_469011 [Delitschia confertaspora ATCC 74209]